MYDSFLSTISQKQWKRIGIKRRSGVAVPLFSIYSKKSVGIGELPDLKLLIDWCKQVQMSIIQLLPLNDSGFSFTPYDAQSSFALDPMYLSIDQIIGIKMRSLKGDLDSLRRTFPLGRLKVNYKIKAAKLELLWNIFKHNAGKLPRPFTRFTEANDKWLRNYALFKAIKEECHESHWEAWPPAFKERDKTTLLNFERKHKQRVQFFKWLQWQLFEQLKDVKEYGKEKDVYLMGDLPFLASRDSAEVWSQPDHFKLDLSSGAPPDSYFFKGQRWGMPPCSWEKMEADGFKYFIRRLKYAEHFYDLLRVDHVVGFFRLWSVPVTEPAETGGMNGFFDPRDESKWEGQGRKLLSLMIQNTKMLIAAEDLGTVPECSYRVLEEFGLVGMDVQRWQRDSNKNFAFKEPQEYRNNSITTLSTHDMTSFNAWWEYEASTVYEPLFKRTCESHGIDFESIKERLFDLNKSSHERLRWKEEIQSVDVLAQMIGKPLDHIRGVVDLYLWAFGEKEKFWDYAGFSGQFQEKSSKALAKAALEKAVATGSIFSVHLLHDWLALSDLFKGNAWDVRFNVPGIISEKNWSLALPIFLEELKRLPLNKEIKALNHQAGRI